MESPLAQKYYLSLTPHTPETTKRDIVYRKDTFFQIQCDEVAEWVKALDC